MRYLLTLASWLLLSACEGTREPPAPEAALVAMQKAVDLETSTEKSPVTPGEVLPAQELLGDLHLTQGSPKAALAAYRASLARSPGRMNSVLGAIRAAQAASLPEEVSRYRAELLVLVDANTTRPGVQALVSATSG